MTRKTGEADVAPEARFELVLISELLPHEMCDPDTVDTVEQNIKSEGAVLEPILVAEGSLVVLNGHHRLEVLKRLGARKVPAWVIDYEGSSITVDLWPGSGVPEKPTKKDIVARARKGHLYPPKTSRHQISKPLPKRRTPLHELY
ncbi:MAG: ParB N-terminal domain-containing protein [Candidatus Thermoplasmatota archaeon]|jgi:hypothetical protein|nr:ParB N-terminal domain-containing protein [Candidatus Thermoplasmatota archaeon]MCL5984365.1 ParB N-terminal domain-containing protein [Candidatus Thermoplasmatota archaeon]